MKLKHEYPPCLGCSWQAWQLGLFANLLNNFDWIFNLWWEGFWTDDLALSLIIGSPDWLHRMCFDPSHFAHPTLGIHVSWGTRLAFINYHDYHTWWGGFKECALWPSQVPLAWACVCLHIPAFDMSAHLISSPSFLLRTSFVPSWLWGMTRTR